MHRSRYRMLVCLATVVLAASAILAPAVLAEPQASQGGTVTMQYLGHSHYRFTSVNGKVILTNPWLSHPALNLSLDEIPRADLILVSNGHLDEVGDAIAIAQKTGAKIVAAAELNFWFMGVGIPQEQIASLFFSPGDRFDWEGITIRLVNAVHGVGLNAEPGPLPSAPTAGIATGFFITFENGLTTYFAGSSAATQDMALWAEMYKPDIAILGLDAGREPLDFAMMARLLRTENPNLRVVFPHHHFPLFFPQARPTVADAQAALDAMGVPLRVTDPGLRETFTFMK